MKFDAPILAWLVSAACAAAAVAPARAGTVGGRDGLHGGEVTLSAAGAVVGGKTIAWDDVLYICTGRTPQDPRHGQGVRLKSSEVWRAEITALSDGQLTLGAGLLGQRTIDLGAVGALDLGASVLPVAPTALVAKNQVSDRDPAATLDFGPASGGSGPKSNTLYRAKGEPVPGKLLWMDAKRIAIDSPLGVLAIQRGSAPMCYVLSVEPAGANSDDRIILTDGSEVRAQAKPGANALEIEHPILGHYSIPIANIAAVVRHRPWATYLSDMEMRISDQPAKPLLTQTVAPRKIDSALSSAGALAGNFLAAIRLAPAPGSRLSYKLPPHAGSLSFRATVLPVETAQGSLVLRMSVGTKEVFKQEVAADAAPQVVALELPGGDDLVIEAEYGAVLAFPCGVLLADPVLIAN